ncbi:MAG TPA: hydrogenase [Nitratifractor sp.]|nr:hydrogenase [Nitratifractor sp.]HHD74494.1 hydrogenase [Nitratifractor sp.]HHH20857.1 hydrogenase [Nitratifractor sp.]
MTQSIEKIETTESKIRKLLQFYAKNEYTKSKIIPHVTQKVLLDGHFYKDLNLRNRFETAYYMSQYFPSLSLAKPSRLLWKKYIFNIIGENPSVCNVCKDTTKCLSCRAL